MKTKTRINMMLFAVVLASLACSLGSGSQSGELPDGLTENYALPPDAVLHNTFTYSEAQQSVIQQYGNPTRFIILFGETARQETWFYDATGYTVVFRDGEKVSEKSEAAEYREGMYATVHSPDLFYHGMAVDEVVLATDKSKFMLTSVPELEHMRLMDLEGLTLGMVNGKISYVETIPALTETLLTSDDFAQLTPEEAANQGVHAYMALYKANGETMQEMFGEIEFGFQGKEMFMIYEGDRIEFEKLDTNQYFADVDGGLSVTFISHGLIVNYFGDGTQISLRRTDGQALPVETTPDQVASTEAPTVASHTPEELANEGTNFFIAHYSVNGEDFEDDFGTIEIIFYVEEFSFTYEGETILFNQIGQNEYYSDVDGGLTITFSAEGFVFYMHRDNTSLILTRQD